MRPASIVFNAILLSLIASGQAPAQSSFASLTPEKQMAACARIEQTNAERMQEGSLAVHPLEELCYPTPKTFGFTNKPDAKRLQQIAEILRAIVQAAPQQISVDAEASTVTFHGAPGKVEMVGWLIRELDQPAYDSDRRAVNASVHEMPVPRTEQDQPGRNDEVMRVFPLAHTTTVRAYQEILAVLRTVADVQKATGDSEQFMFVVRAPVAQMELAAYLIQHLDIAPGSRPAAADFLYKPPARPFAPKSALADTAPPDVVRVFYPAHITTPQAIQQIMNALRTVLGIEKVFMDTTVAAIPVRGTVGDIANAEWLIKSLDIPNDGRAALPLDSHDHVPESASNDGAMRVFYLGPKVKAEGLHSTLTQLQAQDPTMMLAECDAAAALIVRGSASQMAQAERTIEQSLVVN